MLTPSQQFTAIQASDQILDGQNDLLTPSQIHLQAANRCEDSARNWKGIAQVLFQTDPSLSVFAQRCAIDNELLAAQERQEANRLMGVAA